MRLNLNISKAHRTLLPVFILLIAGCSIERNLKLDAQLPLTPAFKQIPLRIGVYYSPEFIEHTKKIQLFSCGPNGRKDNTGIFFIFPVGTASRDLFGQVIASMFITVTTTSVALPSSSTMQSVDGLLEPMIESFEWDIVCPKDIFSEGRVVARVNYLFNLYDSPKGKLVASMRVAGQASEKPKLCLIDCKDSIASEQAMLDAMARFMVDFQEQQEVRQWLSIHSAMPGNHR